MTNLIDHTIRLLTAQLEQARDELPSLKARAQSVQADADEAHADVQDCEQAIRSYQTALDTLTA